MLRDCRNKDPDSRVVQIFSWLCIKHKCFAKVGFRKGTAHWEIMYPIRNREISCTCSTNLKIYLVTDSRRRSIKMAKTKSTPKLPKRLNAQQRKIFVAKGFTKALLNAIISDGWDKRDIDDYILGIIITTTRKYPSRL